MHFNVSTPAPLCVAVGSGVCGHRALILLRYDLTLRPISRPPFFRNVSNLPQRPKYEMCALALHEVRQPSASDPSSSSSGLRCARTVSTLQARTTVGCALPLRPCSSEALVRACNPMVCAQIGASGHPRPPPPRLASHRQRSAAVFHTVHRGSAVRVLHSPSDAVTVLWPCCGSAVAVLWQCCGRAVAVLWQCCGSAVAVL